MLPPFRIRQLRSSNNPSGPDLGDDFLSSPDHSSDDSLVEITASDYDSIVRNQPHALLSYMDEDDGEVITVGSSFELSQRLDEPVRSLTRVADSTSTRHIFDLDPSNGASRVWKALQEANRPSNPDGEQPRPSRKGKERAIESPGPPLLDHAGPSHGNDLEVHVDEADDASRAKELQDERDLYFVATKAPKQAFWKAELESVDDGKIDSSQPAGSNVQPDTATSLTAEGARQAMRAGAQLRDGIRSSLIHFKDSVGQTQIHQNRWASYGRDTSSVDRDSKLSKQPTVEDEVDEAAPGDQAQQPLQERKKSLLEAYEDELRVACKMNETGNTESANVTAPRPSQTQASSSPPLNLPEATSTDPFKEVTTPGELFVHTIGSLATGLSDMGAELKGLLSEANEQFQGPIQNVPHAAENMVRKALDSFNGHVQQLAHATQNASNATRQAAERTRQADLQTLESTVSTLRNLAMGVGNLGEGVLYGSAAPRPAQPSGSSSSQRATATEAQHDAAELADGTTESAVDASETENSRDASGKPRLRVEVPLPPANSLRRNRFSSRSLRIPGEIEHSRSRSPPFSHANPSSNLGPRHRTGHFAHRYHRGWSYPHRSGVAGEMFSDRGNHPPGPSPSSPPPPGHDLPYPPPPPLGHRMHHPPPPPPPPHPPGWAVPHPPPPGRGMRHPPIPGHSMPHSPPFPRPPGHGIPHRPPHPPYSGAGMPHSPPAAPGRGYMADPAPAPPGHPMPRPSPPPMPSGFAQPPQPWEYLGMGYRGRHGSFHPPRPPPPPEHLRPEPELTHPQINPRGPRPLRHRQSWHPETNMPKPPVSFGSSSRPARNARGSRSLRHHRSLAGPLLREAESSRSDDFELLPSLQQPLGESELDTEDKENASPEADEKSGFIKTLYEAMLEEAFPAATASNEPVGGGPDPPQHRRMGWESFLQQYERTPGYFPNDDEDRQREWRPRSGHRTRGRDASSTATSTPSKNNRIGECVEHLQSMGFVGQEHGGSERLLVYAQAADGDLETAMEIIEEDRKAHEERRGGLSG